jgi:hypothetical protein
LLQGCCRWYLIDCIARAAHGGTICPENLILWSIQNYGKYRSDFQYAHHWGQYGNSSQVCVCTPYISAVPYCILELQYSTTKRCHCMLLATTCSRFMLLHCLTTHSYHLFLPFTFQLWLSLHFPSTVTIYETERYLNHYCIPPVGAMVLKCFLSWVCVSYLLVL